MIKVCKKEKNIHIEVKGTAFIMATEIDALIDSVLKHNPEIIHAVFLAREKDLSDLSNVDTSKVSFYILY